jgi:hypothetical protein
VAEGYDWKILNVKLLLAHHATGVYNAAPKKEINVMHILRLPLECFELNFDTINVELNRYL